MAKKKEQAKEQEVDKSKKKNPVIMILLLIIVMGAGSFAGTYVFMKKNPGNSTQAVKEVKVVMAEELAVNLSDEENKFLKTTVYISYDENNEEIAQEITDKTVEIKDRISFFLRSKKAEDFKSSNEENLKKELLLSINQLLTTGEIINVYFPDGLLVN